MKKIRKNERTIDKLMKGIIKITKHKTFKNKIYAIGLIIFSVLSAILLKGDITVLIFTSLIAIPLFFSKENWIV